MFALVADIERYPEFVPLCLDLTIRSSREKQGKTILLADMTAGYKAIRETVTTQVVLDPESREIRTAYVEGPFEHLENVWRFHPLGQGGCDIEFKIDYAFKSRALGLLMGSMFERAFAKFTNAFEGRADVIYKEKTSV